jgi:predicted transposase/invertase (TIGR01784 family)
MAKKKKTEEEIVPSVYINPLTDFGFKKLFYDDELMIAFLNDVIGTEIKNIQHKSTEGLGEFKEERTAVFDILCTTKGGESFVVEMQLEKQENFKERVLFYASHIIRKQAPRRKNWDYALKKVYVVSILNFIAFTEKEASDVVIERISLYRENAKKQYSDKLNLIFVELPKFNKQETELKNNTETWLFLLKNTFKLNACPPEITGKVFKRFLELAEVKQLTPMEMEAYTRSLERSYQMRNIVKCAKMDERMDVSRQFVSQCAQDGVPLEKIALYTNLSTEQVRELLKQNS